MRISKLRAQSIYMHRQMLILWPVPTNAKIVRPNSGKNGCGLESSSINLSAFRCVRVATSSETSLFSNRIFGSEREREGKRELVNSRCVCGWAVSVHMMRHAVVFDESKNIFQFRWRLSDSNETNLMLCKIGFSRMLWLFGPPLLLSNQKRLHWKWQNTMHNTWDGTQSKLNRSACHCMRLCHSQRIFISDSHSPRSTPWHFALKLFLDNCHDKVVAERRHAYCLYLFHFHLCIHIFITIFLALHHSISICSICIFICMLRRR